MTTTVTLDEDLSLDDLLAVAHGAQVALGPTARGRIAAGRSVVDKALADDAAVVAAEMDAQRLRGITDLVRRLGEQGYLRDDVTPDWAVDVLFLLTSWNTYDQLRSGRGLDQPAIAERLITTFTRTLCRPETLP